MQVYAICYRKYFGFRHKGLKSLRVKHQST